MEFVAERKIAIAKNSGAEAKGRPGAKRLKFAERNPNFFKNQLNENHNNSQKKGANMSLSIEIQPTKGFLGEVAKLATESITPFAERYALTKESEASLRRLLAKPSKALPKKPKAKRTQIL